MSVVFFPGRIPYLYKLDRYDSIFGRFGRYSIIRYDEYDRHILTISLYRYDFMNYYMMSSDDAINYDWLLVCFLVFYFPYVGNNHTN